MELGKIFPAGVGPKSPARQTEALADEGVSEKRIGDDQDEYLRQGDTLFVAFAVLMADDCASLARWFERVASKGASLYVVDAGERFDGIAALPALIEVWQSARRKSQTAKARAAQAKKPKTGVGIIKTDEQKKEFRRLWRNRSNSVAKLARMYECSELTIHRARRQLKLPSRQD